MRTGDAEAEGEKEALGSRCLSTPLAVRLAVERSRRIASRGNCDPTPWAPACGCKRPVQLIAVPYPEFASIPQNLFALRTAGP
jgi:hypothetical protein